MKSTGFPKMFGTTTSTNIIVDRKATLNNLTLLLCSQKGTLLGDPFYGTRVRQFMFDQNSDVLKDVIIDDIYEAIKVFIPQVDVKRNDIDIYRDKRERGTLFGRIKVTYLVDFTQEVFTLVLFQEEE